jgi:TPR repeat protein
MQEGLRWLTRAAEAGDTAAQTQLATLAMQGATNRDVGGLFGSAASAAPDFAQAEHWSRLAAAAGSAEAKGLLASILTGGPPEFRDVAAGAALYRECAEAGGARGRIGFAMLLLQDATPESAKEAQSLLQAAAADGVPIALHLAGMMHESGSGGTIDLAAAAASYKAAAEMGHAPAQLRHGLALLYGRGTKQDRFTAETWLRRAALSGETEAAAVLGQIYSQSDEQTPNHAEAAMWFHRAAEAGDPGAARALARIHLLGLGVPKDVREALPWLRIAARAGDDAARAELAQLSLKGQTSEEDRREAIAWFRPLAAAGVAAAQFNLGLFLAEGIGVERDEKAALGWFRRAAETLPSAQICYARMLAAGRGCEPDPAAAQAWLQQAAGPGPVAAEPG